MGKVAINIAYSSRIHASAKRGHPNSRHARIPIRGASTNTSLAASCLAISRRTPLKINAVHFPSYFGITLQRVSRASVSKPMRTIIARPNPWARKITGTAALCAAVKAPTKVSMAMPSLKFCTAIA